MDEKKIAVIIFIKNEEEYLSTVRAMQKIQVPSGFEVELLTVTEAEGYADAYQSGMEASDAKYKVYIAAPLKRISERFYSELFYFSECHPEAGMRGFYCTESVDLAKEWACGAGTDGYANKYELDLAGLSVLDLLDKKYNILNWLALLTKFRSYWQKNSIAEQEKNYLQENFFVPQVNTADVIVGYRADDSYFSFARDFINNSITLETLGMAMRLGKLGEQIVIKSEAAFARLNFLEAATAKADIFYRQKKERDRQARLEYRRLSRQSDVRKELLMADIMREGIKNGDPRLYV